MTDETARSIERRFLGIAEVDSGTLLIGDPAHVLPRASTGRPGVDYEEVVRADSRIHGQPLAACPSCSSRTSAGTVRSRSPASSRKAS